MGRLVRDVLSERAARRFIGRREELAVLVQLLEKDGPLIVVIHGTAGIGKSALLHAFAAHARTRGAVFVHLDCREIEPTERGFLVGLRRAIGGRVATVAEAGRRLSRLGPRVVLALDTYEVFRLLDAWFRQSFVPTLPDNVRVVLAGREPPVSAWRASAGWESIIRTITLEPLPDADAIEILTQGGVVRDAALRINRFARGLPVALRIAAEAASERRGIDLEGDAAVFHVIKELTRLYVSGLEPATRRILDAASVVRRVTVPLLDAMLPDRAPQDSFERLRTLPFVETAQDGLFLHDTMRESISASLKSADPQAHRRYRQLAWHRLREEAHGMSPDNLWRYTADLLYLIEDPVVREAFFPTTAHVHVVDRSQPEDWPGLQAIMRIHEPPPGRAILEQWWAHQRDAFRVVRDQADSVIGFYVIVALDALHDRLLTDPFVAGCTDDLRQDPVPTGQRVLLCRRWLGRDAGEGPCPFQSTCWLDIKRIYMEMRPALRRIYCTAVDPTPYLPALRRLGFEGLTEPAVIGESKYFVARLDFGPGSVDGWLARIAGSELGVVEEGFLDSSSREIILDGSRMALTALEFDFLQYLHRHAGRAVTRAELLEHVWGYSYHGGSNVIEAVVRTLRKKLADHASMIEAVRGVGYRLSGVAFKDIAEARRPDHH